MDDFFNRNGTINQLYQVGRSVASGSKTTSSSSRLGWLWGLLKNLMSKGG